MCIIYIYIRSPFKNKLHTVYLDARGADSVTVVRHGRFVGKGIYKVCGAILKVCHRNGCLGTEV